MHVDIAMIGGSGAYQFNDGPIELIKLRTGALDTGRLKLATWGTKKQLVDTLRNNRSDHFRNKE